jgi:hypothetical protein
VPQPRTTPDASPTRPLSPTTLLPSAEGDPLGARYVGDFVAGLLRPADSRAYASPTTLPPSSQGSLPACRAQLWPGGTGTRRTANPNFMDPSPTSIPFGPALPGRSSPSPPCNPPSPPSPEFGRGVRSRSSRCTRSSSHSIHCNAASSARSSRGEGEGGGSRPEPPP